MDHITGDNEFVYGSLCTERSETFAHCSIILPVPLEIGGDEQHSVMEIADVHVKVIAHEFK